MAGLVLEKTLNKGRYTGVNLACIGASVLIVLLYLFFRRGFGSFFDSTQLISFLSIAILIIALPNFLRNILKLSSDNWLADESVLSVFTLFCLVLLGFISEPFGLKEMVSYFIIILAAVVLAFEVFLFFRQRNGFLWLIVPVLFAILALVVYSGNTQSMFYYEQLWLGEAHQDSIFHMALSNMFNTTGTPTLGLHGVVELKYHWLSHFIFGQLNNITSQNTMLFYALGYVVIFTPFFIKSLYVLSNEYCLFRYRRELNLVFFALTILMANSFLNVEAWKNVLPLVSESFGLSLTFSFLYLSSLVVFIKKNKSDRFNEVFFVYSILMVASILMFKISTGMVLLSGLSLLFVLNYKMKLYPILILTIICFGIFVKLVVVGAESTMVYVGVIARMITLMRSFDGLLSLFGAFVFLCFWLNVKRESRFKPSVLNNEYGFLLALTVTGFALAFYVAFDKSNAFYFGSVQFFIAFPLLICFFYDYWTRWTLVDQYKTVLISALTVIVLAYHLETVYKIDVSRKSTLSRITKNDFNPVLKETIDLLLSLNHEAHKSSMVIFLDENVRMLFHSKREFADFFIPSGLSGIASVGGIREDFELTKSEFYGLGDYFGIEGLYINDLEHAQRTSKAMGYKQLLYINKNTSDKIVVERFALD